MLVLKQLLDDIERLALGDGVEIAPERCTR